MAKKYKDSISEECSVFLRRETYYTVARDKAILFISQDKSFYSLNSVGTKIWELIDGRRSIKDLIGIVSEDFNAEDRDEIAGDILGFIKVLSKKGVVCLKREKTKA